MSISGVGAIPPVELGAGDSKNPIKDAYCHILAQLAGTMNYNCPNPDQMKNEVGQLFGLIHKQDPQLSLSSIRAEMSYWQGQLPSDYSSSDQVVPFIVHFTNFLANGNEPEPGGEPNPNAMPAVWDDSATLGRVKKLLVNPPPENNQHLEYPWISDLCKILDVQIPQ